MSCAMSTIACTFLLAFLLVKFDAFCNFFAVHSLSHWFRPRMVTTIWLFMQEWLHLKKVNDQLTFAIISVLMFCLTVSVWCCQMHFQYIRNRQPRFLRKGCFCWCGTILWPSFSQLACQLPSLFCSRRRKMESFRRPWACISPKSYSANCPSSQSFHY